MALVDDEDYERLSAYHWSARAQRGVVYAQRAIRSRTTMRGRTTSQMHREILGLKPGERCDHRDGNGINNQKGNLRRATQQQNSWNRKVRSDSQCGTKGVTQRQSGKWSAYIYLDSRTRWLGTFGTRDEAVAARVEAARANFGDFAHSSERG